MRVPVAILRTSDRVCDCGATFTVEKGSHKRLCDPCRIARQAHRRNSHVAITMPCMDCKVAINTYRGGRQYCTTCSLRRKSMSRQGSKETGLNPVQADAFLAACEQQELLPHWMRKSKDELRRAML